MKYYILCNTRWKRRSSCMWILCAWWVHQNKHNEGGEPNKNHTRSSPQVFVVIRPLCVFVCERERETLLSCKARALQCWCGWKGCLKRGGLGGIQACVSFSFKQCVGRPSVAHRHAIPSPTDNIIHQPHRGNADGWGGRGEAGWTEELFRVSGDKDGGGRCKGDMGSLTVS